MEYIRHQVFQIDGYYCVRSETYCKTKDKFFYGFTPQTLKLSKQKAEKLCDFFTQRMPPGSKTISHKNLKKNISDFLELNEESKPNLDTKKCGW